MLQNIRDNTQGLIAKFIIGLIIIPFALFGIDSLVGGGGQAKVATVNGEDISLAELDQAVQMERRRLLNLLGDNASPEMFDEARLRTPALEQLIQRRLLLQAAKDSDIGVSSVAIDQNIIAMQQFQVDGKFSQQLYQSVLRSNGYSTAYFKQLLTDDMLTNQINTGVAASDFVTPQELSAIAEIVTQARSFRYLTLPKAKVLSQVSISDDDIAGFYNDNLDSFMAEEQVKLDYIEVRQQDFFQPVSEADLKEAYTLELEAFQASEERRASHILIEVTDERDDAAALALLTTLSGKLESGELFSDLAQEYSDDMGSATAGGDLGFTQGDTFPAEFEEALFALPLNEVSTAVQTDSGYHLIMATEIKVGNEPSLEELKPVLTQRLQLAAAEKDFVATVEDLRDFVFNSEGLKAPAKELSLTVSQSDFFGRSSATGTLANSQVIAAAFSDDVLNGGNNSAVLELAPDHFIVVHVSESKEAQVKPLEEVKEQIVDRLTNQRAIELSEELAAQLIAQLESGASIEDLAKEHGYEWQVEQSVRRNSAQADRQVLQAAFTMSLAANQSPSATTLSKPNGDVVVVQLEKVEAGSIEKLSSAEVSSLRGELQRNTVGRNMSNMISSLREQADVSIL